MSGQSIIKYGLAPQVTSVRDHIFRPSSVSIAHTMYVRCMSDVCRWQVGM